VATTLLCGCYHPHCGRTEDIRPLPRLNIRASVVRSSESTTHNSQFRVARRIAEPPIVDLRLTPVACSSDILAPIFKYSSVQTRPHPSLASILAIIDHTMSTRHGLPMIHAPRPKSLEPGISQTIARFCMPPQSTCLEGARSERIRITPRTKESMYECTFVRVMALISRARRQGPVLVGQSWMNLHIHRPWDTIRYPPARFHRRKTEVISLPLPFARLVPPLTAPQGPLSGAYPAFLRWPSPARRRACPGTQALEVGPDFDPFESPLKTRPGALPNPT
jgi:hypothetical protein